MSKGKNFSCNNANGKRRESDFYQTPYSLTKLLLDDAKIIDWLDLGRYPLKVLEPACGDGAITKVLLGRGIETVVSYDSDIDFLKETSKYPCIITNPPYSLADRFIEKAKEVSSGFVFLLPLSYLHGKKRFDKFYSDRDYPLYRVYVFTRYPMLEGTVREDGKHKTGMMVYAWFWFLRGATGSIPVIKWLDNNDYVLRSKRSSKQ